MYIESELQISLCGGTIAQIAYSRSFPSMRHACWALEPSPHLPLPAAAGTLRWRNDSEREEYERGREREKAFCCAGGGGGGWPPSLLAAAPSVMLSVRVSLLLSGVLYSDQ